MPSAQGQLLFLVGPHTNRAPAGNTSYRMVDLLSGRRLETSLLPGRGVRAKIMTLSLLSYPTMILTFRVGPEK